MNDWLNPFREGMIIYIPYDRIYVPVKVVKVINNGSRLIVKDAFSTYEISLRNLDLQMVIVPLFFLKW